MAERQVFKVGDEVWFKNDVEGRGVVAEVTQRRSWSGEIVREYMVKSKSEPNGYPFHRMARFDYELGCMVVDVDDDHIWA